VASNLRSPQSRRVSTKSSAESYGTHSGFPKGHPYLAEMTTVILRIKDEPRIGLRGTVELPGFGPKVFRSDEDLLDTIYEWLEPIRASGKGSGSTSKSAIRVT
jgi:hypothetical protein